MGLEQHPEIHPGDYDPKEDYLEQPCKAVATLTEIARPEDDLRTATVHVWASMTDIVDYVGTKGGSESSATKDSSVEVGSYFMRCFQKMTDAGRAENPLVSNINANGEFLNCFSEISPSHKTHCE